MKTMLVQSVLSRFLAIGGALALMPFTSIAQLPNAWQITDSYTTANTLLYYTNRLNLGQQNAATNGTGGFRMTVVARMVEDLGGPQTMAMAYGMGNKRFLIWWDLDSNGNLTANLDQAGTYTLTTNGTGTALYHSHEIIYNPTNGTARYVFDGQVISNNWSPSSFTLTAGEVHWGASASGGRARMNFHQVRFEITNTIVALYNAGTAGNSVTNPATQGWTLVPAIPVVGTSNNAISADAVTLPVSPVVTTLVATDVEPYEATLRGTVNPGGLGATVWFEWGTNASYGNTTAPRFVAADTNAMNFSQTITGLLKGTDYHFRCVVANLLGIAHGGDVSFETPLAFGVTTLSDAGPGSLRQAIADAHSGDTIVVATNGVITVSSMLLITNGLTIVGPGPELLSLSGGNTTRVLWNDTGATSIVSGLSIRNGQIPANASGAGVVNYGVLTLSNCIVTANRAANGANGPNGSDSGVNGGAGARGGEGAGIYSISNLTLIACTISYNTNGNGGRGGNGVIGSLTTPDGSNGGAGNRGGNGAGVLSTGTLTMTDCSVIGNVAGAGGAGGTGGDGRVGFNTDGGDGGDGGDAGRGAGVYATDVTTLLRCLFVGNRTASRGAGGAGGEAGGLGSNGTAGVPGAGGHGAGVSMISDALTVRNCSFADNTATSPGLGGGVFCSAGSLVVLNSTVVDNAAGVGGGIYKSGNPFQMTNSIVALNSAGSSSNVFSTVLGTNNFVDADPLLAPLGDYGGPTMTRPPFLGSPVIDAGGDSVTNLITVDQRGYPRFSGAHVDIGAVEVLAGNAVNPPMATTLPATNVAPHTATLRGRISSHGADTTMWFEWGTSTNYGNTTVPQFVEGNLTDTDVIQPIINTVAGWTHHYRLVVVSQQGTTFGQNVSFSAPAQSVTNLASSGPGTLREAMQNAVAGDIITFARTGTITVASTLVTSSNVTVVGPGPGLLSISGGNSVRVFWNDTGVTSVISGVTIRNGRTAATGNGAGVVNLGILTLSNCVVTANRTGNGADGADGVSDGEDGGGGGRGGHGAGIYSTSSLTLIACTISNNTNGNGGLGGDGAGGILHPGGDGGRGGDGGSGAGIYSAAMLTMIGCTVENNSAGRGRNGGDGYIGLVSGNGGNGGNSGQGGGLWASGPANLAGCTFQENRTATGGAGGYSSDGVAASIGAGGSGGGIFASDALILSDCVITANITGQGPNGPEGGFGSSNDGWPGGGSGNGGGIYASADLTLIGCTISYNTNGAGGTGGLGGFSIIGGALAGTGGVGGPGGHGGGIYSSGNLTMIASTISHNRTGVGGTGGVGGDDWATAGAGPGGTAGAGGNGGGIYSVGTLAMTNCVVEFNQTANGGVGGTGGAVNGGLFGGDGGNGGSAGRGAGSWLGGTVTIRRSIFQGNKTGVGGDGGEGGSPTGPLGTPGSKGSDGVDSRGAGVYDNAGTVTIYNSTFTANQAQRDSKGGAIYSAGGSLVVVNSTLVANSAANLSGGISMSIGAFMLTNSIVALNIGGDVDRTPLGTNNFILGDPLLAPLGNYGGPTPTMPPLPGSPVIDAGLDSVTNWIATDQRGYLRRSGAHVDIGAVEVQQANPNNPPVLNPLVGLPNGAWRLTFTNDPAIDFSVFATTNVAAPWNEWIRLGSSTQLSPGLYQYTDSTATNYPQRFYKVGSP
jgi:fibronectin-binding autotransporter adhesin